MNTIYSRQFILVCVSSFLFFASFNMIIPELPAYLSSLGGEDYKGLIIALFTLSACLSRPFSGKLADNIGRVPVIFFGILMSFICGLMYPILSTVAGFFLLRFLHGFSTGFTPTGTAAYIADIVPANRRGEALGMLGLISNIGTAFGPAMGSEIVLYFSINILFYTAAGFALISMLILLSIRETLAEKHRFSIKFLKIQKDEIIEWRVIAPAIVMLLTIYAYGAVLTIIPDFSTHLGLKNKGVFFTFYTVSSLGIRFLAGRLSDIYGRVIILKYGTLAYILALVWLGFADSITDLMVGAVLYGIAAGMCAPTIFAWAIDLGLEAQKGKGIATVFIALEIGIGLGALITGWLYDNDIHNVGLIFYFSGFLAFLSFIYLQFGKYWGTKIS